jgi:hypothetical protein
MSKKGSSITTWFVIGGREMDLADCSRAVGLEPSKVWTQTRPELRGRPELNTEEWMIGCANRPLSSVDDAVTEVLKALWPARERIVAYARAHSLSCSIACRVHIRGDIYVDRPEYVLNPRTIAMLSQLDAGFSMDLFVDTVD